MSLTVSHVAAERVKHDAYDHHHTCTVYLSIPEGCHPALESPPAHAPQAQPCDPDHGRPPETAQSVKVEYDLAIVSTPDANPAVAVRRDLGPYQRMSCACSGAASAEQHAILGLLARQVHSEVAGLKCASGVRAGVKAFECVAKGALLFKTCSPSDSNASA